MAARAPKALPSEPWLRDLLSARPEGQLRELARGLIGLDSTDELMKNDDLEVVAVTLSDHIVESARTRGVDLRVLELQPPKVDPSTRGIHTNSWKPFCVRVRKLLSKEELNGESDAEPGADVVSPLGRGSPRRKDDLAAGESRLERKMEAVMDMISQVATRVGALEGGGGRVNRGRERSGRRGRSASSHRGGGGKSSAASKGPPSSSPSDSSSSSSASSPSTSRTSSSSSSRSGRRRSSSSFSRSSASSRASSREHRRHDRRRRNHRASKDKHRRSSRDRHRDRESKRGSKRSGHRHRHRDESSDSDVSDDGHHDRRRHGRDGGAEVRDVVVAAKSELVKAEEQLQEVADDERDFLKYKIDIVQRFTVPDGLSRSRTWRRRLEKKYDVESFLRKLRDSFDKLPDGAALRRELTIYLFTLKILLSHDAPRCDDVDPILRRLYLIKMIIKKQHKAADELYTAWFEDDSGLSPTLFTVQIKTLAKTAAILKIANGGKDPKDDGAGGSKRHAGGKAPPKGPAAAAKA